MKPTDKWSAKMWLLLQVLRTMHSADLNYLVNRINDERIENEEPMKRRYREMMRRSKPRSHQ